MLFNTYGNGVYKKYQIQMGNPYPVKQKRKNTPSGKTEPTAERKKSSEEEATAFVEKARKQAEEILQEANREANAILDEAQEKISAHMLEVEQQAKEEGYRSGETLAREHYQSLIGEAEDLRRQAKEAYENTISSLEHDIVETILDISRRVIGTEVQQNKEVVIGLVRTAMLGSFQTDEVVVRVCPQDYDYVQENKDRLLRFADHVREITIIKDGTLDKGDCFVETGLGSIDSSIETQLAGIERSFRELLGKTPADGETNCSDETE